VHFLTYHTETVPETSHDPREKGSSLIHPTVGSRIVARGRGCRGAPSCGNRVGTRDWRSNNVRWCGAGDRSRGHHLCVLLCWSCPVRRCAGNPEMIRRASRERAAVVRGGPTVPRWRLWWRRKKGLLLLTCVG